MLPPNTKFEEFCVILSKRSAPKDPLPLIQAKRTDSSTPLRSAQNDMVNNNLPHYLSFQKIYKLGADKREKL